MQDAKERRGWPVSEPGCDMDEMLTCSSFFGGAGDIRQQSFRASSGPRDYRKKLDEALSETADIDAINDELVGVE